MENLGSRIKHIMDLKKLNYSSLARELSFEDLHFEHSNIRKYVMNKVKPSTDFYTAMSIVFDVNLNWLLTGKGKKFNSDYVEKDSLTLSKKNTDGDFVEYGHVAESDVEFIATKKTK